MNRYLWLTIVLACSSGSCRSSHPNADPNTNAFKVIDILGHQNAAGDPGYEHADAARPFVFPEDHGPHSNFRNEWWYFTGNLETAGELKRQRHFGYQLTVFRTALAPRDAGVTASGTKPRTSGWATQQLYMAHLALSDLDGSHFYAFDRFDRGAAGLAGALASPFHVWVGDWDIASLDKNDAHAGTFSALKLHAERDGILIDLELEPGKGVVAQGDRGLSQKGPFDRVANNASYYYSMPRMPTRGTLRIARNSPLFEVHGASWMDREWSTSALEKNVSGWDWFALHLSNGFDLMLYRLRRADNTSSPFSEAALIDPQGRSERIRANQFELEVTAHWSSPRDGTVYPSGWKIKIPKQNLELNVSPSLANQELNLAVRYWEGAVHLEGAVRGTAVTGTGYVELTGYQKL